ncbi:MAG TPA: FGGY-family carbohydrate kinase [Capillimicrobium sp.]|nr:FGGY-family carbohydrate kinase [Capillimicrobium sp.]
MSLALGIDVGTTATKAIVIDDAGRVVAETERRSELSSPHPGWAEEDTAQWWGNVTSLAADLPLADVRAVGVSGMVPCVICLDEDGRALRPSIQQNDARAVTEVEELAAELADRDVLQRTGSPITQQSVAPTARWLARHEPDVWDRTRTILGSYDLIVHRLTGERAVEANWALESGLYDLRAGGWAEDVCAAAGIDPDRLPPVKPSSEVVGEVSADAARATGLPAGIPVVAGSADHVASAFAAGLVEDGDLLVKLGGAGDILLSTGAELIDERLYLDFHLMPDRYLPNGCMAASGSLIRWFHEQLGRETDLAALDEEARRAGPGAGGLVLLPYVLGEKTPVNDPRARGVLFGMHLGHTRGHVFRAVLEGISYGFRHHLDVFRERGHEPRRVRVTNGGARSELWKQVTADVLGLPLEVPRESAGSALGAAFLAAKGAGMYGDWRDIERFVEIGRVVEPDPSAASVADDGYAVYRELYPTLRPLMHREPRP